MDRPSARMQSWLVQPCAARSRAVVGVGLICQAILYLLLWPSWRQATSEELPNLRGQLLTVTMVSIDPWSPPNIQYFPSAEKPFVLFHLRKSAGSTLRDLIAKTAKDRELEMLVPCYSTDCRTYWGDGEYHRHRAPGISVIAGHFSWAIVSSLARETAFERMTHYPLETYRDTDHFSCLTILREPVSRFISCFYYRSEEWRANVGRAPFSGSPRNLTSINEFTLDEWQVVVKSFYDFYGYGCNNEGIRIFSGVVDEPTVNTLTDQVPEGRAVLARSKSRLGKCVVGLVEDLPQAFRAVSYWFPWLPTEAWSQSNRAWLNKFKGQHSSSKAHDLPEPYLDVIREANRLDIELYNYAKMVVVPQQQAYMDAHPRTRPPTRAPTMSPTMSPTMAPTPAPTSQPTPVVITTSEK